MSSIGDYNTIMSDHNIFNQVVYTPLSDALRLLEERQKDVDLVNKIKDLFAGEIPEILNDKNCAVIARQLATPNHECRAFVGLARENNLKPIFFEYYDDKFTSNNKYKHSLGQIHVSDGLDKKGDDIVEKINIVDFNIYNGKKIKEIKTKWDESLIDFHHKLFGLYGLSDIYFHDESSWYKENNADSIHFVYFNFFLFFVCHGILFENFLVSTDSEGDFTKEVVLPALEKVINLTGLKPLIVPIPPMDIETEDFWYSHLSLIKNNIK
ncbi:MAG: hypothetical protein WC089_01120 [Candidatus Paceibacterota bacterium]